MFSTSYPNGEFHLYSLQLLHNYTNSEHEPRRFNGNT